MTNPKPTEGWAAYTVNGDAYRVYTKNSKELADELAFPSDTIIPVTIIPTDDLVREAARVLLDDIDPVRLEWLRKFWKQSGGEWHGPKVERWSIPEANMPTFFTAALRALAGQGGE
jgi:hypothetical protein